MLSRGLKTGFDKISELREIKEKSQIVNGS
jgi:hypothetical protein